MDLEALLRDEAKRSKDDIPEFPKGLEQLVGCSRDLLRQMMAGIMGCEALDSMNIYIYALKDITGKELFVDGRRYFSRLEIEIAWKYCHQRRAWGNKFENRRIHEEFAAQWRALGGIDYIEKVGSMTEDTIIAA